MPRCFKCQQPVPEHDAVYGPLCGAKEDHPDCGDLAWHPEHRIEWLAELALWAEVTQYDDPSEQQPDPATP